MDKFYIAYGSNLNLEQMALRCPTATIYGIGMLINWKLTFRSMRGPAFATIEPSTGSQVPVIIWKIDKTSEKALDNYEGFPLFYYKRDIKVKMDNGRHLTGMVYIMNRKAVPGIPTKKYISTIAQGYLDNNLSIDYLMNLIKTIMI